MIKRSVTVLGSTGSVGINTLKVIAAHADKLQVKALAAGSQASVLREQVEAFKPEHVYVRDDKSAAELSAAFGSKLKIWKASDGLTEFSAAADSDILVAATSGTSALGSVVHALERGRKVALANKEILVVAGALVMSTLRAHPKAELVPIDSEHSAIFQCLAGQKKEAVRRLILTSSGGPLREVPSSEFSKLTKENVINHPKWKMGRKISVDSATLMNKGLEIIEAAWLFDLPVDRIDVLIHPEAIIHSMVEFVDASVMAQLGVTDMRLPIQYALTYPERWAAGEDLRVDFAKLGKFTFALPDRKKFPCLDIAYEAAKRSGTAPCVLSAADEVAVHAYLEDRISFLDIPRIIEKVLSRHSPLKDVDLRKIQEIHAWAVEEANRLCLAH